MWLQVLVIALVAVIGAVVVWRRRAAVVLPEGTLLPPSPQGHFLLQHIPLFNGPYTGFVNAHEQLGSIVRLNLIGYEAYSVADLDDQAKILQRSDQLGNLPLIRLTFGRVFPKIMAFLEGDEWKRIRRISQHALNVHKLSGLVEVAVDATHDMFDVIDAKVGWENGRTKGAVDLRALFAKVLFDAFSRFGFGYDWNVLKGDNADVMELLHSVWSDMLAWVHTPFDWQRRLPTPHNTGLLHRADKVRDLARMVMNKKKAQLAQHADGDEVEADDLLSALLLAHDADGDTLSEIEIVENIIGFFYGSYETSVNLLSFMCYQMARNPEKQEKVFHDIQTTLADTHRLTWETLEKAEYLTNATKETLRIQPQANQAIRLALEDFIVGKYFIPKNSMILLQNWIPSHDPKIWGEAPEEFRPERWTTVDPVQSRKASSPFGLGSRMCIGYKVAMAEARAIVATLVKNYRLIEDPNHPPVISMTLQNLCHDGRWILEKRDHSASC